MIGVPLLSWCFCLWTIWSRFRLRPWGFGRPRRAVVGMTYGAVWPPSHTSWAWCKMCISRLGVNVWVAMWSYYDIMLLHHLPTSHIIYFSTCTMRRAVAPLACMEQMLTSPVSKSTWGVHYGDEWVGCRYYPGAFVCGTSGPVLDCGHEGLDVHVVLLLVWHKAPYVHHRTRPGVYHSIVSNILTLDSILMGCKYESHEHGVGAGGWVVSSR